MHIFAQYAWIWVLSLLKNSLKNARTCCYSTEMSSPKTMPSSIKVNNDQLHVCCLKCSTVPLKSHCNFVTFFVEKFYRNQHRKTFENSIMLSEFHMTCRKHSSKAEQPVAAFLVHLVQINQKFCYNLTSSCLIFLVKVQHMWILIYQNLHIKINYKQ